jgi:hypothetical protein
MGGVISVGLQEASRLLGRVTGRVTGEFLGEFLGEFPGEFPEASSSLSDGMSYIHPLQKTKHKKNNPLNKRIHAVTSKLHL